MELTLEVLLQGVDAETQARIDVQNRARVQRAWEVQHATGKPLLDWQKQTGPAPLPLDQCFPVVFDVDKDWLNDRIARRFDLMIEQGALDEVEAVRGVYDPALPAHRAIGVPELMQYLDGDLTLDQARQNAVIATRQFAKRQRTWMRSKMANPGTKSTEGSAPTLSINLHFAHNCRFIPLGNSNRISIKR